MKYERQKQSDEVRAATYALARREARRDRRYGALMVRHLPAWAPDPIARGFRAALQSLNFARLAVRSPEIHGWDLGTTPDPARDSHALDHQARCVVNLHLIKRLCTYTPEMETAWKTVANTPITNERMSRGLDSGDDVIGLLLVMLEGVLTRFEQLPKRTPAAKKASLSRVAKATENLIKALNDDPEACRFAHHALADYFGMKNVEMRFKHGETPCFSHMQIPRLAIDPPYTKQKNGRFETPRCRDWYLLKKTPWNRWTPAERYQWLNGEIQSTRLTELLETCRAVLEDMAKESSRIAQPGRADQGFLPFIIRELSAIVKMLYGKPLDSTVALLVSAIADSPTPLSRDEIRSYTKTPGKKSNA